MLQIIIIIINDKFSFIPFYIHLINKIVIYIYNFRFRNSFIIFRILCF